MRARLLEFVQALRARGIEVSVAETLDATAAVAAAGVERGVLREGLAATLVKDEDDRPTFDQVFDVLFPTGGPPAREERKRRRAPGAGDGAVPARGGGGGGGEGSRPRPAEEPRAAATRGERARKGDRREASPRASAEDVRRGHQRLMSLPFDAFTSRDVEEARGLVRELGARLRGRLARRERHARRGRLDFRRTLRAAVPSGGVPARLRFRGRRPGRADLVVLCDLSGSVAAASELCLGLIAPAADYFRRVHLFAYVDRLCSVSIEGGHVAPEGRLDLHARSDVGRVLDDLWQLHKGRLTRTTVVLVLGDARNNRLPPRADLLRAVRDRVKRIVWLVPEPRVRWSTGDSVLHLYAPACEGVVECLDLATLVSGVRQALIAMAGRRQ